MRLNSPEVVSVEYASEHGLESRRSIYAHAEGPDPNDVLWDAIAAVSPWRVLEVGPGPGELSARIAKERRRRSSRSMYPSAWSSWLAATG